MRAAVRLLLAPPPRHRQPVEGHTCAVAWLGGVAIAGLLPAVPAAVRALLLLAAVTAGLVAVASTAVSTTVAAAAAVAALAPGSTELLTGPGEVHLCQGKPTATTARQQTTVQNTADAPPLDLWVGKRRPTRMVLPSRSVLSIRLIASSACIKTTPSASKQGRTNISRYLLVSTHLLLGLVHDEAEAPAHATQATQDGDKLRAKLRGRRPRTTGTRSRQVGEAFDIIRMYAPPLRV